jgi:hypothetical protein
VKTLQSSDKWLVAAAVCFAGIFIGYAHAGLPLALAAPAVWMHWGDADVGLRWVGGGAAVGAIALVASFLCGPGTSLGRTSAWTSITALVASAAITMAVTEVWVITAVTSAPFVMSVREFVARAISRRTDGDT